jgi:negative regulator of sigma E activity
LKNRRLVRGLAPLVAVVPRIGHAAVAVAIVARGVQTFQEFSRYQYNRDTIKKS